MWAISESEMARPLRYFWSRSALTISYSTCGNSEKKYQKGTPGTHIVASPVFTTLLNDIHVKLGDFLVRPVARTVVLQRQVREKEVDRRESSVKVLEDVGKSLVELAADVLSLQRTRSRENGDLSHGLEDVCGTPLGNVVRVVFLERRVGVQEVVNLLLDETSIGAECVGVETPFDKLFLFHEDLVRDGVYNVVTENGRCQVL